MAHVRISDLLVWGSPHTTSLRGSGDVRDGRDGGETRLETTFESRPQPCIDRVIGKPDRSPAALVEINKEDLASYSNRLRKGSKRPSWGSHQIHRRFGL